jgi:type II secretion system protein N
MVRINQKTYFLSAAVAYALLLFVGLTLSRLPIGNMISYCTERTSKGRLLLKIERAAMSLPTGFRLENVSYVYSGGDRSATGQMERIDLNANLFGLVTGRLPLSFDIRPLAQGGRIQGSVGMPLLGRSVSLEVKLSEVDVGGIGLASLSGREVKGTASGQLKFKGDPGQLSTFMGEGLLLLRNGSVDTRMDMADLKAVPFESVRIPVKVSDGRLLLEKGEMDGPMLSGTLSGQVNLNKRVSDSVLDLTARMKPGPLLEKNPFAGPLLSKVKEGGKEIVLKIGGTIKQPTMAWTKN